MDWRVKMIGERVLGFVPYGEEIHSLFEGYRGYNVGRNLETKLSGKLLHISYLLKHTDFDFNGATILEIGTGWDGCDILLFYLLGANEVHTFDNIAHLSLGRVLEMLSVLTKNADEISSMFNIPIEVLERRMADIDDTGRDLTGFLRLCNIHYQAPAHFAYSEFDKEVDLFYTFSVLQRLPIKLLRDTLEKAYTLLRSDGISYHEVRHRDHNLRHDRTHNNPFHYYKYSDWFWELLQSHKFNYQNRLTHFEMLKLMEETGFRHIRENINRRDPRLIEEVDLASKYREYDASELVIGSTTIISSKHYSGRLIRDETSPF